MSVLALSVVIALLAGGVAIYLWPRPEVRFEKLFVATLGALVGSLIGRVVSDPRWQGHFAYVAAGAFVFSAVDLVIRMRRSAR
jgi:hypothetical protein